MKWLVLFFISFFAVPASAADYVDSLHEGDAVRIYQWCETVADLEGLAMSKGGGDDFLCWQSGDRAGGVLGPAIKTITDQNGDLISIHEVTNVIVEVAPGLFEGYSLTKVFTAIPREAEDA